MLFTMRRHSFLGNSAVTHSFYYIILGVLITSQCVAEAATDGALTDTPLDDLEDFGEPMQMSEEFSESVFLGERRSALRPKHFLLAVVIAVVFALMVFFLSVKKREKDTVTTGGLAADDKKKIAEVSRNL